MTLQAWLTGHQFDLETLADLFAISDPRIGREAGGCYLTSTGLDQLPRGGPQQDAAARLLHRVNGLARILRDDFRPVQLAMRFTDSGRTDSGRPQTDSGSGRLQTDSGRLQPVRRVTAGLAPAAAVGPDYLALSAAHPALAEVIDMLGRAFPAPSWVELYRIYEMVRDSIAPATLDGTGWVSAADLGRFARQSGGPAKQSMTVVEARRFVLQAVRCWMEALRQPAGPTPASPAGRPVGRHRRDGRDLRDGDRHRAGIGAG